MQITFDHISSPEEIQVLADAMVRLAQIRDRHRAEFRELVAETAPVVEKETAATPKRSRKPAATPAAAETAPAEAAEPAAASESHSETAPAPVPPVTLEEVRAKLAALSQAGKKAEAKALLDQFGVAKLTDLPADKYAEVLAAAEEI